MCAPRSTLPSGPGSRFCHVVLQYQYRRGHATTRSRARSRPSRPKSTGSSRQGISLPGLRPSGGSLAYAHWRLQQWATIVFACCRPYLRQMLDLLKSVGPRPTRRRRVPLSPEARADIAMWLQILLDAHTACDPSVPSTALHSDNFLSYVHVQSAYTVY